MTLRYVFRMIQPGLSMVLDEMIYMFCSFCKVYDGIIILCSLGLYDPDLYLWSLEYGLKARFKLFVGVFG